LSIERYDAIVHLSFGDCQRLHLLK